MVNFRTLHYLFIKTWTSEISNFNRGWYAGECLLMHTLIESESTFYIIFIFTGETAIFLLRSWYHGIFATFLIWCGIREHKILRSYSTKVIHCSKKSLTLFLTHFHYHFLKGGDNVRSDIYVFVVIANFGCLVWHIAMESRRRQKVTGEREALWS